MEALNSVLNSVRQLRMDVVDLFDDLSAGLQPDNEGDDKENSMILIVQNHITNIRKRFKTLEEGVKRIPPNQTGSDRHPFLDLHQTGYLAQEATVDRELLYPSLIYTHKWADWMNKCGAVSVSFLSKNPLRKATFSNISKRFKRFPPHLLPNQLMVLNGNVEAILNASERVYPEMRIMWESPQHPSMPFKITIHLERVLKAVISLRRGSIEWVVIKGQDENALNSSSDDLVTSSIHPVFQRVTEHAHSFRLNFPHTATPEYTIKHFFTWLNSYMTLFSAPCKRCEKHLYNYFPPTWRDLVSLDPYHIECRP